MYLLRDLVQGISTGLQARALNSPAHGIRRWHPYLTSPHSALGFMVVQPHNHHSSCKVRRSTAKTRPGEARMDGRSKESADSMKSVHAGQMISGNHGQPIPALQYAVI